MKAVDVIRVRELLGTIASSEERLRELAAHGEDIFLGDFRNTESAKYLLIVATEAAIDVCNHIVSRLGGRAPRDYADCFAVLADLKVITAELAGRLRRMARFRNLVVHLYWEVDNAQVYRILCDDLGDLSDFRHQVAQWLSVVS